MTTAGMALAYLKRDDQERAIRLTDRAVKLIDNKKLIGSLHQWASINCQIAELYWRLDEPEKAIESAQRGIQLCRERDSLFILDQLYLYVGRAYMQLGEREKAKENLEIAKSLSVARHGKLNEESIEKELQQL